MAYRMAGLLGRLALTAAAASVSAAALAQNWVEFVPAAEGVAPVSYDSQNVRYRGDTAIVWIRIEWFRDIPDEAYRLSRMEIDCEERTGQTVYTAAYSAEGQLLATDEEASSRDPIPEGSMYDRLQQLVCPGR